MSILPLATGMAMAMTLLAIKGRRPAGARHVLWSRIDQKTCLKAITAAGLQPVVVSARGACGLQPRALRRPPARGPGTAALVQRWACW